MKECLNCGNTYAAKKSWQKFCSIKCRNAFWNKPRTIICPKCGQIMEIGSIGQILE